MRSITPLLYLFVVFATKLIAANSFVELGAPSTDREWQGADYAAVAELAKTKKIPLPRISDVDGELLLNRFCDIENFNFCRNSSLPISERLNSGQSIQAATNDLLLLYVTAQNSGKDFRKELSRICAFTLHVALLTFEVTEEYLLSVPKDDRWETRMKGLRQMKNGVAITFSGIEQSLSEGTFDHDGVILVERAMSEVLPKLKIHFSPEFQTEIRLKLQKRSSASKDEAEIGLLNQMVAELKAN
jgi:hypothetical protein